MCVNGSDRSVGANNVKFFEDFDICFTFNSNSKPNDRYLSECQEIYLPVG